MTFNFKYNIIYLIKLYFLKCNGFNQLKVKKFPVTLNFKYGDSILNIVIYNRYTYMAIYNIKSVTIY